MSKQNIVNEVQQTAFEAAYREVADSQQQLADAQANSVATLESMRTFLSGQIGSTLLMQGYSSRALISVHEHWHPYTRFAADDETGDDRILPGEYTVCDVGADFKAQISEPGQEELYRYVVNIGLLRSATPEDVKTAMDGIRQSAEARYRDLGLDFREIKDELRNVYEPHRHAGATLLTLAGSAILLLGDEKTLNFTHYGKEIRIEDGQLHSAIVGPGGWHYLIAATTEELERQGL